MIHEKKSAPLAVGWQQPRPQAQPLGGHCVELTAGRGGKRAVGFFLACFSRAFTIFSSCAEKRLGTRLGWQQVCGQLVAHGHSLSHTALNGFLATNIYCLSKIKSLSTKFLNRNSGTIKYSFRTICLG